MLDFNEYFEIEKFISTEHTVPVLTTDNAVVFNRHVGKYVDIKKLFFVTTSRGKNSYGMRLFALDELGEAWFTPCERFNTVEYLESYMNSSIYATYICKKEDTVKIAKTHFIKRDDLSPVNSFNGQHITLKRAYNFKYKDGKKITDIPHACISVIQSEEHKCLGLYVSKSAYELTDIISTVGDIQSFFSEIQSYDMGIRIM